MSVRVREKQDLISDSTGFFEEIVSDALERKNIQTKSAVSSYLVDLLKRYMTTENLFDIQDDSGRRRRSTLAEMYLKSFHMSPAQKVETLRRLGDSSLYITGFFAQSLERKVVDVGYYVDMGTSAYGILADVVREESFSELYSEMNRNFTGFVDAFSFISSQTMNNHLPGLMTLFDLYTQTGSDWAKTQLLDQGIVPPAALPKVSGDDT